MDATLEMANSENQIASSKYINVPDDGLNDEMPTITECDCSVPVLDGVMVTTPDRIQAQHEMTMNLSNMERGQHKMTVETLDVAAAQHEVTTETSDVIPAQQAMTAKISNSNVVTVPREVSYERSDMVPSQENMTVETSEMVPAEHKMKVETFDMVTGQNKMTVQTSEIVPTKDKMTIESSEIVPAQDELTVKSPDVKDDESKSAGCSVSDTTTDTVLQVQTSKNSSIKTKHDTSYEFTDEMIDTTVEQAVVDNLFYTCDIDKTGLVSVSSLIRYLKSSILHHQLQPECELSCLSLLLDPTGEDVEVDIATYRKAMMKWIGDIRRESGIDDLNDNDDLLSSGPNSLCFLDDEDVLNSTGPSSPGLYSFSYDAFHLAQTSDCDISDLSNKLEDLQYQYRKQGEDCIKLLHQIDAQEEIITSLTQENLEVSKKIRSLQEISGLRDEIIAENEELKMVVIKFQETKRELEGRVSQMDKENSFLVENTEHYRIQIQQLLADLEAGWGQISSLQVELAQQKQLVSELQDVKTFHEVQLAEKELKNKNLLASVQELNTVIEDLRTEYKNLQQELVQAQQQLQNVDSLGHEASMSSGGGDCTLDDEDRLSHHSSCDTSLKRSSSIHNELKQVLNNDPSPLPSPLCERYASSDDGEPSRDDRELSGDEMLEVSSDSSSDTSRISDIWDGMEVKLAPLKDENLSTDPVKLVEKCKEKYTPILVEICKVEDVHKSRSWPSTREECNEEETPSSYSKHHLKQLVSILCRLEGENEELRLLLDKSAGVAEDTQCDLGISADERYLALQMTLMEERTEKVSLQEELQRTKHQCDEVTVELQKKSREIEILHEEIEKLEDSVTTLSKANLDLSEKYHHTQSTSTKLQETLEKEKQLSLELEGSLSKARLAREVDLRDIWRLVHKDVEMEYMDDQNDSLISSSTDLLKDQIAKEIETLRGRLLKREAALGVLKGKPVSLELGSVCKQYNPVSLSPSSPLVDALTIDFFDGKYNKPRQGKKVCTFNVLGHHSLDMDKSRYDDSKLAAHHTVSCPSLHQQRQQSGVDGSRNNTSYSNLTTSSSSSTSGVDTSPRYHRSTDGQNKRRDFIRSSVRHENSSTTTTTSNSADSNTTSDCSYLKQQQIAGKMEKSPSGVRRFSFKAAIENRKDTIELGEPLPRNRSSSYHAAIEQGQKDSTEDIGYASSTTDTTPEHMDVHLEFWQSGAGKTDSKSVSFHLKSQNVYEYYDDKCSGDFDVKSQGTEDDAYHNFEAYDVYHSSPNGRQLISPARKLSTLVEEEIDHFDGQGDTGLLSPSKQDKMLKYSTRLDYNKSTDSAKKITCDKSPERGAVTPTKMIPGKSGKVESPAHDRAVNLASSVHTANTQTTVPASPQRQLLHSSDGQSAVPHTVVDLKPPSPDGNVDLISKPSTFPSRLAQLRETNLAKKREHMKSMKLPDVQEQMDINNTTDTAPLSHDSMDVAVIPPAPSTDPVMPSISDHFLKQLGLKKTAEAFKCDDLSEQEIEAKFLSLSLAFKTDKLTLEQRKDIQERSRDIAERNIDQELQGLRNVVQKLNELISDDHVHELVMKIRNHIDILEQTAARVSSRAEVFGAVQQEVRMSLAMEVMVVHVENIKRAHEKDRLELNEARKQLEKPFGMSGISEMGSKRSMSVCPMNFPQKCLQRSRSPSPFPRDKTRRRSEVALPLMLGGAGSSSLKHSASLDFSEFMECRPKLRRSQTIEEVSEDAKQRFQAAVASTSVQNAITTTLRRASIERQNAISSQSSLSRESSILSRESSTESRQKEQSSSSPTPSKQSSQEEDAYQKGFEDGVKAKLGKELSELREQQNSIGNNIEEVMEKIEHSEEELLKENKNSVAKSVIQFQNIAVKLSWDNPMKTLRFIAACFIILVAVCVVIMTLFTGSVAGLQIQVGRHHYGMPPV